MVNEKEEVSTAKPGMPGFKREESNKGRLRNRARKKEKDGMERRE